MICEVGKLLVVWLCTRIELSVGSTQDSPQFDEMKLNASFRRRTISLQSEFFACSGAPKVTVIRPGFRSRLRAGKTFRVPRMATGITGQPASTAA